MLAASSHRTLSKPDCLTDNQSEPAFHKVKLRRAGASKVQVDARMSGQPLLHRPMLVCP